MGSDDTQHRLLRATAMEIARHGYKGASLRGIAARVHIRAASIFHYFPGGKEELVRAMLGHIMETIATRMTPTLDAATELPPADVIVQCSAQLWDFMAEHPEYAGTLMRGAFEPEESLADVVRDNAERVVAAAIGYFQAAQGAGALANFDVRRFLLRLSSYVITFHAAPSMRRYILGPALAISKEREAFLRSVRAEITGQVPSSASKY